MANVSKNNINTRIKFGQGTGANFISLSCRDINQLISKMVYISRFSSS